MGSKTARHSTAQHGTVSDQVVLDYTYRILLSCWGWVPCFLLLGIQSFNQHTVRLHTVASSIHHAAASMHTDTRTHLCKGCCQWFQADRAALKTHKRLNIHTRLGGGRGGDKEGDRVCGCIMPVCPCVLWPQGERSVKQGHIMLLSCQRGGGYLVCGTPQAC